MDDLPNIQQDEDHEVARPGLKDLIRGNVVVRGFHGPLSEKNVRLIERKLDGRLTGSECVYWKGAGGMVGSIPKTPMVRYNGHNVNVATLLFHNISADIGENYGKEKGDKVLIRHKCISDRRCVNPSHLELGSSQENRMDAIIRDKTVPLKFSEEDVIAIREMNLSKTPHREIALKYGTIRQYISDICLGVSYPYYGGPIKRWRNPRPKKSTAKIATQSRLDAIRRLYTAGKTKPQIIRELSITADQATYGIRVIRRLHKQQQI